MPLERCSPSSSSDVMMFDDEDSTRPDQPWSSRLLWKSSSTSLSGFSSEKRPRRTVSLCFFAVSLICFCCVALALGLGLGLGWPRYKTIDAAAAAPFNYSSYYRIPAQLDVVPIDRLVNARELDLDMGFNRGSPGMPRVVREYVFNVSQAHAAPDGFQKPMILVNGQSPGPLIEANIGDTVRVHVYNHMGNWSTAIHWHGIDQRRSTWMDGVAGVTQCGIPPGRNFTYDFVVDGQRGTYWWHAHLSVQYSDGMYGPIVIHDPKEMVPETDDEKVIFVSDVYHTYGSVLLASYLNPTSKWVPFESGVEPLPDNILLNGQSTYDCAINSTTYPPPADQPLPSNCTGGRPYTTRVRSGQRVRLRLINASSFLSYWFSVDNHTLEIVELDGVEIEPIDARGVYLNLGQRASVILTADQPPGNYHIRATLPQSCFLPYAPYSSAGLASAQYAAQGILSYDDINNTNPIIGVAGNVSNPYGVDNNAVRGDVWEGCDDMPFEMSRPMRAIPAFEVGDGNMHYIEYAFRQAQDTAYAPLPNNATLWKAVDQHFVASEANSYNSWDFGLNQQVLLVPDADKGAQIVINSRDAMEHPWHLHSLVILSPHLTSPKRREAYSHTFQIVGWGKGYYGATSNSTTWNLANPMRRDTVTVPAFNHVVIRFEADNPGLWALHCHVAWHMEGGMFVSIAERPGDLVELVTNMDPATRVLSQSFCGMGDGRDIGTESGYDGPA
ncbi:Uu.00g010030.m01.CDS01 [Anthostomella pinea]|uniref:Uu.00g010030.m01.CDS01 n=1 Tax=Anthostomella pinea TaxID=933095 RepID=A0AAI8VY59_9PEZI|nr:Uu.00g010030.m01.CDS01 [Anthostomella pinea]